MKKVDFEVQSWSVKRLFDLVITDNLDLDTDYQREPIWSLEDQELLIDSIYTRIDIPKLYIAKFSDQEKYECIDGKQRILSLVSFRESKIKNPNKKSYNELTEVEKQVFDSYKLTVTVIFDPDDAYIRTLFRRLQLGKPLSGGEKLHAKIGNMREFVFKELGKEGPFVGNVGLSKRRYSRESTLAQMIINSSCFRGGLEFRRARYEDLEKFFDEYKTKKLEKEKTQKIRIVLGKAYKAFGPNAIKLKSRAAIVSAYLFVEELIEKNEENKLRKFGEFYLKLLDEIRKQMVYIRKLEEPPNKKIIADFQKNLEQASVEPYSIERRHNFLRVAFEHYLDTGKIIRN